jgi:hypothetical protein
MPIATEETAKSFSRSASIETVPKLISQLKLNTQN